jgi:hypothetical protein
MCVSYADGGPRHMLDAVKVPSGHGRGATGRGGGHPQPMPRATGTPRATLGIVCHVPRGSVRRGARRAAGLAGQYTDDLDIWPSAYDTAGGVRRHSCSDSTR